MTDKELRKMQRSIDKGIQLAHHRLLERAGHARQSLVVWRDGKIIEIVPERDGEVWPDALGDPLARCNGLQ